MILKLGLCVTLTHFWVILDTDSHVKWVIFNENFWVRGHETWVRLLGLERVQWSDCGTRNYKVVGSNPHSIPLISQ